MREKGTNPPIVTTYVSGLRGKTDPSLRAVSKYVKPKDESSADAKDEHLRARVLTLKLDL
jgi:hypothetical protein